MFLRSPRDGGAGREMEHAKLLHLPETTSLHSNCEHNSCVVHVIIELSSLHQILLRVSVRYSSMLHQRWTLCLSPEQLNKENEIPVGLECRRAQQRSECLAVESASFPAT